MVPGRESDGLIGWGGRGGRAREGQGASPLIPLRRAPMGRCQGPPWFVLAILQAISCCMLVPEGCVFLAVFSCRRLFRGFAGAVCFFFGCLVDTELLWRPVHLVFLVGSDGLLVLVVLGRRDSVVFCRCWSCFLFWQKKNWGEARVGGEGGSGSQPPEPLEAGPQGPMLGATMAK